MWSAFVAFMKTFGPLLTKLSELLITLINEHIEYVQTKKERLANAIIAEYEALKKAKEIEKVKAESAIKAFRALEDYAWIDRHEVIVGFIKKNEYENVLKLIRETDNEEISKFLFDEEIDQEYRALKIVNIMKRGRNV